MRDLTRSKSRADILLERAKTIAVVGPTPSERNQAALNYLRDAGYDVVHVPGSLADVPGGVDLVLVLSAPAGLTRLLEEAAAKRVDGIWFTQQSAGRLARGLAGRFGLTVVVDADIVGRHRAVAGGGAQGAGGRTAMDERKVRRSGRR